ncbi:MAG TPA: HipA domain-containing protein [Telluria sp.]|nr:HipA domain-containing protein [Telluria sp.]
MNAPHQLALWVHDRHVADIGYAPLDDAWSLQYAPGWRDNPAAFPLSPALPLHPPADGQRSASVRRFLENLLPEGRALDIVAASRGVAKTNVYGLIQALGSETTGAFRFLAPEQDGTRQQPANAWREISLDELDQRIAERDQRPFVEWDGQIRMSVAGYQDKLLIYADGRPEQGARMVLPDYPLASTHILKPQPLQPQVPHMVVNEHYCMTLARALGFPAAEVAIMRTPRPVLAITRFDRAVHPGAAGVFVERKHIIDVCQAADLPVSYKYERHIGSTGVAAQYRDGVSLPLLFEQLKHVNRKAVDKLAMLRWALFQFVIGNCDAHGKNFSFFVQPSGLAATPWYDLVSVVQYPQFAREMAMAFGDEFRLDHIKGYALADFAQRCAIDRQLLIRECRRLNDGVQRRAGALAEEGPYEAEERVFAREIARFAQEQAARLLGFAIEAAKLPATYL